jgi:hypothetical protein
MALNFSRNISKSLNKGDWCSNKNANQARVMPNNKVPMSLTWNGPVEYQWGWSQMTKCIWLTKLWTCAINLLVRLIRGSFGWGCVVEMHPKEVEAWLVRKWIINSWNA